MIMHPPGSRLLLCHSPSSSGSGDTEMSSKDWLRTSVIAILVTAEDPRLHICIVYVNSPPGQTVNLDAVTVTSSEAGTITELVHAP